MNDKLFDQRVREALLLALDRARSLPHSEREDVAQLVVIAVADELVHDNWQVMVLDETDKLVKRTVRRLNKEAKNLEEYKEWLMTKKRASEKKRLWIRDLAELALVPREWQVLHGRYWKDQSFKEIAESIGMSVSRAHELHNSGLYNMMLALRRNGIDSKNWSSWYYDRT